MDLPASITLVTITPEQLAAQNKRIDDLLALNEALAQRSMLLLAGLQHFTREEVAGFFCNSVRTIDRRGKDGDWIPIPKGGKTLYSGLDLLAFSANLRGEVARKQTTKVIPKSRCGRL